MKSIFFISGFLFFVSIIWYILVLINPNKFMPFFKTNKRIKGFGIFVLLFFLFGTILGASNTKDVQKEIKADNEARIAAEQKQEQLEKQEQLKKQQAEKMKDAQPIKDALNVTDEQALSIYNKLSSLGFNNIKDIEFTLNDKDLKYYSFKANETKTGVAIFATKNNELYSVTLFGTKLMENGNIISSVKSQTLSSQEMEQAQDIAIKAVKPQLKDPSSANFDAAHFHYAKTNNIITIYGKVYSKNSFGANVPTKFTVEWNLNTHKYNVNSLETE